MAGIKIKFNYHIMEDKSCALFWALAVAAHVTGEQTPSTVVNCAVSESSDPYCS